MVALPYLTDTLNYQILYCKLLTYNLQVTEIRRGIKRDICTSTVLYSREKTDGRNTVF